MQSCAIKIGGSLYASEELVVWLKCIAQFAEKNIIIVPGGGPFADQVRAADERLKLEQKKAHLMAVLAMQQYAMMLSCLNPAMQLVNCKEKIFETWEVNKVAVWEPFDMVRDECPLEASWENTSDSIAAWLTAYMQIKNLVIVKSTDEVIANKDLKVLANSGCIDKGMPELKVEYNINIHVLHKSQTREFEALI